TSFRTESAVRLLPQPDSPTTPSTSPGASARLTPSTATCSRPSGPKTTRRFSIASSGSPGAAGGGACDRVGSIASANLHPQPWIQDVAQAVAEQVEAEAHQRHRDAGEEADVRRLAQVVLAFGDHVAPGGRGWRRSDAQEAEDGLGQDGVGE